MVSDPYLAVLRVFTGSVLWQSFLTVFMGLYRVWGSNLDLLCTRKAHNHSVLSLGLFRTLRTNTRTQSLLRFVFKTEILIGYIDGQFFRDNATTYRDSEENIW